MNDLSIVRCTPPQWKRLRDIRLRALADSPESFWNVYEQESTYDENAWRDRLTDTAHASLVAERGGGDVGVASVGPSTWDEQADPGHYALGGFWVAPQARGTETAARLLDAALTHAREQGASGVRLWIIGDNAPAEALYRGAGFEPTGRAHELSDRPGVVVRELLLIL